ncbi:MAG: serine/threonine protein kinase [Gemmatimonadales bacterium]|nr:MAG: serine/threonine protein kinase [Gemmatimonadales bacterium]
MSDPNDRSPDPQQTFDPRGPSTPGTSQSLPDELLQLSVSRIRIVSGLFFLLGLVSWSLSIGLRGKVGEEFENLAQWGPPTFMLASSALVFGLTFLRRLPAPTLLGIGWAYHVAVSFSWSLSQYLGVFDWVPPGQINVDQFGMSGIGIWMVAFAVLVPARPRLVLIALLSSAAAVPLTYLLVLAAVGMESVSVTDFFLVLVLPYLLTTVVAYLASRALYRLRIDAIRAKQLGAYRLDRLLGHGGMGDVWRGTHRLLARPAAIKLIARDALTSDPGLAKASIARFEREAQATANLRSPHTVELYDYGVAQDGTLYYVMELLDGIDLQRLVEQEGPLPPERVIHVLTQVCASLAEAHHQGLVHRDIKPANIYLCRLGLECDFVKVLDFGLVKHVAAMERRTTADHLTQADMVPGTPSYVAPEMILGKAVDGRADIYGLGCVAYWLLTGRLVFEEPTALATLTAHASKEPTPASARAEHAIPPALDHLVLDCLVKDPADRIQTADQMIERLRRIEVANPWTQERALRWWESFKPSANRAIGH